MARQRRFCYLSVEEQAAFDADARVGWAINDLADKYDLDRRVASRERERARQEITQHGNQEESTRTD